MAIYLHLSREDIDQIIGLALDKPEIDVDKGVLGQTIRYTFGVNGIKLGTYTLSSIGNRSQFEMTYVADDPFDDELTSIFQPIHKIVLSKLSEYDEDNAFYKGYTSTRWGTQQPSRKPLPNSKSLTLKTNLQDFEQELTHFVETFEFEDKKKGQIKNWKKPGPHCPDPLPGQGWNILIYENEYQCIYGALIWVTPLPNYLLLTIPPRYSSAADNFVEAFVNFCRKRWDGKQKEVEPESNHELVDKLVSEYEEELLVPFDILDASVSRKAEGYTTKLADSVRHEIVSGARIIYILKWHEFGCFGGVELRKSAPETSWLIFQSYRESNQHLHQLKKEHRGLAFNALTEGLADDGIYALHTQNLSKLQEVDSNRVIPRHKSNSLLDVDKKAGLGKGSTMDLNLRFKGTPYELARVVGWGGVHGTGIIRKRELSGLDTPLEVEKNNRPVQRAIFKAARRLDASAAGDGLADLAYEPINQQAQSVQIKVKRFQFPGEGQIFGEIEPGERMTWLTVTPLDEHWRDYPDSDGWAMLYREINRRGLFVVTPGQDTAGEGQVGLADGKTAPQLSKEDEDLRLAQIAQKYSNKNGEGKILPSSIKTWERIVPLKRAGVSHEKTAENLGMESSTFIYHWRKMKKTGYWEDHKQEN